MTTSFSVMGFDYKTTTTVLLTFQKAAAALLRKQAPFANLRRAKVFYKRAQKISNVIKKLNSPTLAKIGQAVALHRAELLAARQKRLALLPHDIKEKMSTGEALSNEERFIRHAVSQNYFAKQREQRATPEATTARLAQTAAAFTRLKIILTSGLAKELHGLSLAYYESLLGPKSIPETTLATPYYEIARGLMAQNPFDVAPQALSPRALVKRTARLARVRRRAQKSNLMFERIIL